MRCRFVRNPDVCPGGIPTNWDLGSLVDIFARISTRAEVTGRDLLRLAQAGISPHYRNVQGVAERMEAELGEEKWQLIDGCQREWDMLPPPVPPLIVRLELHGGFIHAKDQKSRDEGWFEVIAGKSMPEEGVPKCFAYVQSYDTKPKRRLFELMKSQGLQANQQVPSCPTVRTT